MTPEISLQTAVRQRLVTTAAITALVPATSILDRNERPAPDPSIIIGEKTVRDDNGGIARSRVTVYMDLHVWKREPSTAGATEIAGQIRKAMLANRLELEGGFHCVDTRIAAVRVLRDPDGLTCHAVVTVESIVEELP